MRPISAELLTRIQMLNQTIYGNADPKMQATIIKAITDLDVFTITEGEVLGKIDLAAQMSDVNSAPDAIWLAQVINHEAVIKVYTYSAGMDFTTPSRTFTLAPIGTNARVRDIAIEFDGTVVNGSLQTSGVPFIAWLERTTSFDTCYIIQWDGTGSQPAAMELLQIAR